MANTPIYNLPYPVLGDAPNGPTQLKALADAVEAQLDRIDDDVDDLESVPATQSALEAPTVNTTSTSFVTLAGNPGVAFVAPASGRVLVTVGCTTDSSSATAFAVMSYQIRAGSTIGSGTVFQAVTENNGVGHEGTAAGMASRTTMVAGLTPGNAYNAQALYIVLTGTGQVFFARRNIIVAPTP